MMGADMSIQRQVPMLKPCPCCGGTADYEQGRDRAFFVRCQDCGMRTGSFTWARAAGEAWNRRNTEGARIVTLFEIAELDHGQQDDAGQWAGWIEARAGDLFAGAKKMPGKEGTLRAAVIRTGFDFGDITVYEGGEPNPWINIWPREVIEKEGVDWRLWDRKPTEEQRRDTPWNGPAWHDARAMGTTGKDTSSDPATGRDSFHKGENWGEQGNGEAVEDEAAPEAAD